MYIYGTAAFIKLFLTFPTRSPKATFENDQIFPKRVSRDVSKYKCLEITFTTAVQVALFQFITHKQRSFFPLLHEDMFWTLK